VTVLSRLRRLYDAGELEVPFPGSGDTAFRHRKLAEWARLDLSLARLAEAHVDAVAILHEAGLRAQKGLYGVWAAETPGCGLRLESGSGRLLLTGTKMFCSGAGLIDRALITVNGCLVDVNLGGCLESIAIDETSWKSAAFAETQTATVHFRETPVTCIVGDDHWYLKRPGFWQGACGPAACWAGGALGLVDYATEHVREEAHALAHLGAMSADAWAMEAYLQLAGCQIDANPDDAGKAKVIALQVRHLIEQACSDVLCRFGRAFGPRPLAFDPTFSKRYQELELYIRQCHAERDLESLGRALL
jgi:hypothetical protein